MLFVTFPNVSTLNKNLIELKNGHENVDKYGQPLAELKAIIYN